ncbi:glycosyl transferase family 2 [Brachyspira pilosicoli WesB]|uniref:Glycosyl transferase family 2 n=1 Tax=Brachyspira pilosicoli WesB TaxID=1161918 RepID=K0JKR7_BRAPL|nr:class I SAM-dependent methyltransferase [Brachyspira pilosicoli]CCG56895.1 glycosyl transferase family 2 [Brachyspira pilosicoli WesB]
MDKNIENIINDIVWWIPNTKLRNSIRNFLYLQIDIFQKNLAIEEKIKHIEIIEEKLNDIMTTLNMDITSYDIKKQFGLMYEKCLCGGKIEGESKSGGGSSIEITTILRTKLIDIINRYNIKTFLDAPCGDMYWIKELFPYIENYIGVDIVPDVIKENKSKFAHISNVNLKNLDLMKDDLDKVDLVFCRDCIQHLSNIQTQKIINNIIRSGSKYLLISSHSNESNYNRDKNEYIVAKALNLEKPPFNFPKPIEYIEEGTFDKWIGYNRRMALWEISSLPDQIRSDQIRSDQIMVYKEYIQSYNNLKIKKLQSILYLKNIA